MATTTAIAELLEWHASKTSMPDCDTTVLMWVTQGLDVDWFAGWWDGNDWRDAASGGVVAGEVTHFAEPEGPTCVQVLRAGAGHDGAPNGRSDHLGVDRCCQCGFPLDAQAAGARHLADGAAHSENVCMALLHATIARLQTSKAEQAALMREQCAAICDTRSADHWADYKGHGTLPRGRPESEYASDEADACARAIRGA